MNLSLSPEDVQDPVISHPILGQYVLKEIINRDFLRVFNKYLKNRARARDRIHTQTRNLNYHDLKTIKKYDYEVTPWVSGVEEYIYIDHVGQMPMIIYFRSQDLSRPQGLILNLTAKYEDYRGILLEGQLTPWGFLTSNEQLPSLQNSSEFKIISKPRFHCNQISSFIQQRYKLDYHSLIIGLIFIPKYQKACQLTYKFQECDQALMMVKVKFKINSNNHLQGRFFLEQESKFSYYLKLYDHEYNLLTVGYQTWDDIPSQSILEGHIRGCFLCNFSQRKQQWMPYQYLPHGQVQKIAELS